MMRQFPSKPCDIFRPVQIVAAVAAVVVDELGQPFIDPADFGRIGRIGDARLAAPAEQGGDIVRAGDTPTDLTCGLVRPAFDPRKHAFDTRLVAPHRKVAVG